MDEVVRVFPATCYARESSLRARRPEALEGFELFGADEGGHGLAVAGDDYGLTTLGGLHVFAEPGLDLGDRAFFGESYGSFLAGGGAGIPPSIPWTLMSSSRSGQ